jgi:hypothetical protein
MGVRDAAGMQIEHDALLVNKPEPERGPCAVAWKAGGAGQNETKTRPISTLSGHNAHKRGPPRRGASRRARRGAEEGTRQCSVPVYPVIVKLSTNQPPAARGAKAARQRLLAFRNRHGNRGAHVRQKREDDDCLAFPDGSTQLPAGRRSRGGAFAAAWPGRLGARRERSVHCCLARPSRGTA